MRKISIERRIEDWMVTAPDADLRALAGKIDFVLRYRAGGDPKSERKPRSDKGTKRTMSSSAAYEGFTGEAPRD